MNSLIFWDWSGTLVDELRVDRRVCRRIELEIAELNRISFREARGDFAAHLHDLEGRWEWHDYTRHGIRFGLNWKKSQMDGLKRLRVIPGAGRILRTAKTKGYLNILTTNAVSPIVELRAGYAGLAEFFDGLITSDIVRALKSEGKHFLYGLETWRGDPRRSFSIGNNPAQDILPAAGLGLRTVLCEFGRTLTHFHSRHTADTRPGSTSPDFRVHRLGEIESLI